ncbi:MAG: SET domain-containing protein [Xanthobacteraceae bacterium]
MAARPYHIGRSRTGLGLFATEVIERSALIVEYSGPRIPAKEAHARERAGRNKYIFEINSRWSIDGSGRDNMGRYANHSCRPNACSEFIRGKVMLRAMRRIRPGEEITYDYGKDYVALFFKDGCKCAKCRPDS